jgi:hypothetical protein
MVVTTTTQTKLFLLLALLLGSCAHRADDCKWSLSCEGGTGGTSNGGNDAGGQSVVAGMGGN